MTEAATITRKEAKASGLPLYFTGKPCNFGMVAERAVDGRCLCELHRVKNADKMKRLYSENPEIFKQRVASYRKANPEVVKASLRASYEKHSAARAAYERRWREKNKEKIAAAQSAYRAQNAEALKRYLSEWRAANPDYRKRRLAMRPGLEAAHAAKRRAQQTRATPPWLSDFNVTQIFEIYSERDRITKATGIQHHVDHIIPLRGRTVSGLHVPWNLRIIAAEQNVRKGNRLEMINHQVGGSHHGRV